MLNSLTVLVQTFQNKKKNKRKKPRKKKRKKERWERKSNKRGLNRLKKNQKEPMETKLKRTADANARMKSSGKTVSCLRRTIAKRKWDQFLTSLVLSSRLSIGVGNERSFQGILSAYVSCDSSLLFISIFPVFFLSFSSFFSLWWFSHEIVIA